MIKLSNLAFIKRFANLFEEKEYFRKKRMKLCQDLHNMREIENKFLVLIKRNAYFSMTTECHNVLRRRTKSQK